MVTVLSKTILKIVEQSTMACINAVEPYSK